MYRSFRQTQAQDWTHALNRGDIPDISFQDIFDFYASQGVPHFDFGQSTLERFREYFPEGEPEDYDQEMAARYREAFATTSGALVDSAPDALTAVLEEPDFSAWLFGRYKGDLGQMTRWHLEQTAIATGLEIFPMSPQENVPLMVPSITDAETANPTPPPGSPLAKPGERVDTLPPQVSVPVPFSTVRIASIRETLIRYGTNTGLLHLLETDVDAVDWLLEQFDSPDAIDAWLSEKKNLNAKLLV